MAREVPVASARRGLPATEVARLEVLRRIAMGAAHAMNNAFTTIVGEATFLQGERKQDPVATDACETILAEMDRCAKLTRALLARREPSQGGSPEVCMVRLVRELGALLAETLGRHHELVVHCPDDALAVEGDAGALEVLVLTLVHVAADGAGGPKRLELRVAPASGGGEVCLSLAVSASREDAVVDEDLVESFVAPARAGDALTRAQLEAVAALVAAHGGRRHARVLGPGRWEAHVALPALD